MNREEGDAIVRPYVFKVDGYSAVTEKDALKLLGGEKFRALINDPIRGKGPVPGTIYPWNVIDFVIKR